MMRGFLDILWGRWRNLMLKLFVSSVGREVCEAWSSAAGGSASNGQGSGLSGYRNVRP